jgi:hypothetical protein
MHRRLWLVAVLVPLSLQQRAREEEIEAFADG